MEKINYSDKFNQIQKPTELLLTNKELDKKIITISNKQKEDIKILQSNASVEIKQKAIEELDHSSGQIKEILSIQENIIQVSTEKEDKPLPVGQNNPPKEFKTFKAFDSYIEQRVNDLEGAESDVEKIEIMGDIAASIVQAGGSFTLEKLEKNAEKIKEKIKSIESILSNVKEAAPFLESLKILIPVMQIARLRKGIEECNSIIGSIEEQLKKEPENKNLQQELIKTRLQLNKLEQIQASLVLEEKGIMQNLNEVTQLAVEKLTPIFPQGGAVFEYIGPVSNDILFVLESASTGIKIKQKYDSIKLLKSLKELLKIKLNELKDGKKDLKILSEIKEKEKEIEKLENEIFSEKIEITTEGLNSLNNIFNQIERFLPLGIEGFSRGAEILGGFSSTISVLTNVPSLAEKGKKIAQRIQNIHEMQIQSVSLNKEINKLDREIQILQEQLSSLDSNSAVNHVFKQIESKKILRNFIQVQQNAIHAVGMGNEILNLSEDLIGMLSTGGKMGESALLLLGVSKAMIASLGPASLGLVIGGAGLKATKFLLHGTAIIPKILEERKINAKTSKANKEFEEFIQSVSLFTKDILPLHFDKKNQVLNKSDVVKCLGNMIEGVNKELLALNKRYIELSEKLDSTINETLTKELNSVISEKVRTEDFVLSLIEYSQFVQEMKAEINITNQKELTEFKLFFMETITKERLGNFHTTFQELSTKKEEITKNYNEQLKLDRMGLSKSDYNGLLESLINCLESPSVIKEFSNYFKKADSDLHEAIFDQGLTKEQQAQALLDSIFEYESTDSDSKLDFKSLSV